MELESIWENIIQSIEEAEIELHTVPKTNKQPLWFAITTDGTKIFVNNAKHNAPSSKLSMTRTLSFKDFAKVYPLYVRREKGECVSEEVTKTTANQVYHFAVIKHLAKN